MSQPGAAIFDLDGVLLDTEPLYTQATETVLARYGKSYTWALKQFIMGRSPMQGASWLVNKLKLPISPDQYLHERAVWLKQLFLDCPTIDGAEHLVKRLRSLGVRLAVATSSEREMYDLKVSSHAWFSLFQSVVCGDDPRLSQAKPAPDIFLLAASELGATSDQCLVFEDSPAGVTAGKAAKMRVIARLSPPLVRSDLALADMIVSNYDEIDWEELLRRLTRTNSYSSPLRPIMAGIPLFGAEPYSCNLYWILRTLMPSTSAARLVDPLCAASVVNIT